MKIIKDKENKKTLILIEEIDLPLNHEKLISKQLENEITKIDTQQLEIDFNNYLEISYDIIAGLVIIEKYIKMQNKQLTLKNINQNCLFYIALKKLDIFDLFTI